MAAFVPQIDPIIRSSGLAAGLPCGKQIIKVATTQEEIEQTLKLRFRVFNEELGEGLKESVALGMDVDGFDKHCDHLVILEEGIGVVGTYRLLFGPRRPAQGFYTGGEFDLSSLTLPPDKIVELGRACVDPVHRKRTTLMSLFWGMHRYIMAREARYLIGCASLPIMSPDDAAATYDKLLQAGKVDLNAKIKPRPDFVRAGNAALGTAQVPQLLNMYLEFGAKVLGPAAYDEPFGCFDLPMAFDMEHLSPWGQALLEKFDQRLKG